MALNLDRLEELTAEWKSLQPLEASRDERLWQKLRLEWNYHSNHIEGNTLTYGETKAFLLHDEVSGHHTGREYDEMKGHDLAIKLVRELAASPQDLTEADVRNLNQIILKEPFYKDATTLDGKPSRKLITPGRYKEEPNTVITITGERFEYAPPVDVPARMAKLVEVIRSCPGKEGLEFMAALAITHHEFTLIHPFDDGNGRVARLLTNYVLLKKGLPPLVIPTEKKKDYLSALRQADGGDPALLTEFMADQLTWSLELAIKAAKGESLEETSDIEKEIVLFVREQMSQKREVILPKKSAEILHHFLTTSVLRLFEKFAEKTKTIENLFETRELSFSFSPPFPVDGESWQQRLDSFTNSLQKHPLPTYCMLLLSLKRYLGESRRPFDMQDSLTVYFQEYDYRVYISGGDRQAPYDQALTEEDMDKIVSGYLKQLLSMIKGKSKHA